MDAVESTHQPDSTTQDHTARKISGGPCAGWQLALPRPAVGRTPDVVEAREIVRAQHLPAAEQPDPIPENHGARRVSGRPWRAFGDTVPIRGHLEGVLPIKFPGLPSFLILFSYTTFFRYISHRLPPESQTGKHTRSCCDFMYRTLVYIVFSQLAVGGLLSMLVVPREAGRRFFRFCALACLVFLILALWVGPVAIPTPLEEGTAGVSLPRSLLTASALLAFVYLLAVVTGRIRPQKPLLAAAGLTGSTGLMWAGYVACAACSPAAAGVLTAACYLISALFLGSVVFAMILGHWYLVVPTLHIRPLRALTTLMLGAILARTLLTALTIYVFWTDGDIQIRETLRSFFGPGRSLSLGTRTLWTPRPADRGFYGLANRKDSLDPVCDGATLRGHDIRPDR